MKTLGEIVKILRVEFNYTQKDVSEIINCSTRTFRRIENNEQFPTHQQIHSLNRLFKLNLNDYIIATNKFKNYETFVTCQELRNAILNYDRVETKRIVDEYEKDELFKNGEPFNLMVYAKTNVLYNNDNNPTECIDYFMRSYNFKNLDDIYEILKNNLNSPFFYSACVCVEVAHYELGNKNVSYKLSKMLYDNLNYFIFDDHLFDGFISFSNNYTEYKNIYITISNNYADALFSQGKYEEAIQICNRAISDCYAWKIFKDLEYLNWLIFKSYYKLNNKAQADKYFNHFKVICEMTNRTEFFEQRLKQIESL